MAGRPFGRIALSLSGGGYRAAGFHLGALDLLHRLDVLQDVRVLSTVSGGTFTGCRYALSLARGEPFAEFYAQLYGFLESTNVIARAFERTATPRRLIHCAAEVYTDPTFLGDARFGELLDAKTHLHEILFNATELHSGVAFRFQRSRFRKARIGNRHVSIPRAEAAGLRLADIVAASSCFPGAFEPMDLLGTGLPLMDGGIYDNQGIQGLLLAARRAARRGRETGLFIVSDTQQRTPRLFEFRAPEPRGRLTLHTAFRLGQALSAACLAGAVLVGLRFAQGGDVELALPLVLMAGIGAGLPWLWWRLTSQVRRRFPGDAGGLRRSLGSLTIAEAAELVDLRARSLVALTSDVFLRRIRSLGYDALYADPRYAGRRVASLVYGLTEVPATDPLAPSEALRRLAARAAAMPTTLWCDDPRALREIVACGQATLVRELLRHAATRPEAAEAASRARAIWDALQQDPECLVAERQREPAMA